VSVLLWALVALPLTAGSLLAVVGRPADRAAPAVAVVTAATALGLAVAVAFAHPAAEAPLLEGLPLRLEVDGLSGLMAVTVTAVTTAVLLFSVADIGPREARARFFGLMLLFSGAMLTTVTAATLPVLLMAWEVMGATSWALIGYWWRDPERGQAANTAFLTTRTADLGLYLAAGAALAGGRQSGSLALDDLPHTADPWLAVVTAGVIAAALGKSAQLPFSFWLSRAMQGPSPVSALLHSATMVVAGAYLLLRLEPLLSASGWGGPVVAWTGAVTAVGLGLVAVAQTDLKQLLAASTCAQIGFMVLAAGVGAVTGGTLQLIAHAAAKSLAFLVAGAWLTALGAKRLSALRGAARRHRTAGITFTIGALALAGVPPLALWAAKDVLLAGALEENAGLYAVGLAAAVISAAYSAKALWYVWRPVPLRDARADLPDVSADLRGGRADSPEARADVRGGARADVPDGRADLRGARADVPDGRADVPDGRADSPDARADLPGTPPDEAAARRHPVSRMPFVTRLPLMLLAAACVGLTVLSLPPVRDAVGRVLGDVGQPDPAVRELALSGGLAVVVSAAVWRWGSRLRAAAHPLASWWRDWLGLEAAAQRFLVRPVVRIAEALAAFDDRVLDRAVEGAARGTARLAKGTDQRAERLVDAAVEGVADGTRALGRWARGPQTGQLHQYLAQAVAAFTVLAVVLVLVR
jgi:NADH-quinone oxidoreductase subunit L